MIDANKLPKMLIEDIEWVVEVLCENKMNSGSMHSVKYNKEKEEIKAWLERIDLTKIPLSFTDMKRSKENEEKYNEISSQK